ncbi:phenylacetaldehyde dehydrogenase (plasmid) [Ruegeria pomeroyi DSS-3]|uniref:Phenylacetaldehyde dehydrogenase n=2 Tax=Ruegeria pomeroyi TaxID=89184 RepID=Q5LLB4_RUEPO|nr:aldehyde dehydrogenase family protein [Ruegeria pomeroyi]AAV97249.1 phenylacetaldehyde dehydrogenase [Ruegeria pomeroyi DSS-3]NVK98137.1 aldehyde dehydrogenase family protein [Ruegeria pomeroyi]NVL02680.1 aldehyde dehydrogenase family protein [Ruegeria pomeroyi]HCE72130.1 aldehyde dehydrogenase [Ruegeria sp.]
MQVARPDSLVSQILPAVADYLDSPAKLLLGGTSTAASDGRTMDVFNPATGKKLAEVPWGGAAEIDLAVKAAQAALEGDWSRMRPVERQRVLLNLADLIEANGEELAQLETLNNGKSVMLSRLVEVGNSSNYLRYMAGWSTKIEGSTIDVSIAVPPGAKYQAYTRKEPVGVVGAITPWNFPLNMAIWKLAPALACGNTVVLKPAEETPLTSLRLGELCLEAGLPPGVVNVVSGTGAEAGAALTAHPGVNKLTFTGSTEVGKIIGIQAMRDMKRVTLELGGKAPMVMFDDMDLDQLSEAARIGILFNSGQTCCAGTRIYAQRGIYDRICETMANVVGALSVGSGLDPANAINPMVSAKHQAHVSACIAGGVEEGATPLLDTGAYDGEGYFVRPQIFTDVRQDMRIMQDEVFGPVFTITPFDDPDEAIRMANDTRYGLGASIWTTNLNTMHRYVPQLQAGTVWVNSHNVPDANMPFGGYKQSGIGREHGRAALDAYLETKSVCIAVR